MTKIKPTILFSTYGNHKLGMGHVFRSIELAKYLKFDAKIVFHINNHGAVLNTLKGKKIKDISWKNFKKVVEIYSPDLVIYDKPYVLGRIEKINKVKIIALDYFYYDDDNVNKIINLKNHHFRNYKIKNKKSKSGL